MFYIRSCVPLIVLKVTGHFISKPGTDGVRLIAENCVCRVFKAGNLFIANWALVVITIYINWLKLFLTGLALVRTLVVLFNWGTGPLVRQQQDISIPYKRNVSIYNVCCKICANLDSPSVV